MMPPAGSEKERFAVVIPVYNHGRTVRRVVQAALGLNLPIYVVDDGSTDGGCTSLESMPGVHLLVHPSNLGKGAALLTGFRAAADSADWVITLDADGQHDPEDARVLMASIGDRGRPVVVGFRKAMFAAGAPWTSRFGRGFSNFWVHMAGGPRLTDSQSGFRIYPLPEVLGWEVRARRYQFEVEVLVKAGWHSVPVVEAPIDVIYAPDGERVSHFRPFVDFVRNSNVFTRLIVQNIFIRLILGRLMFGRRRYRNRSGE